MKWYKALKVLKQIVKFSWPKITSKYFKYADRQLAQAMAYSGLDEETCKAAIYGWAMAAHHGFPKKPTVPPPTE